jgi:hydrogenase maturation factor
MEEKIMHSSYRTKVCKKADILLILFKYDCRHFKVTCTPSSAGTVTMQFMNFVSVFMHDPFTPTADL